MKFKCSSCEKERPCTLTVKGDAVLPTKCPFSDIAKDFVEWVEVKKKEQSK